MKNIIISLLLITLASSVNAESSSVNELKNIKAGASQPSSLKSLLSYRSPAQTQENVSSIDASKRLNGGGTRGNTEILNFQLLAPQNHTALTSKPQPVIYWYVSGDETKNVTLNLSQVGDDKILVEKIITVQKTGLQQIELASLGVSLQPDVEYQISLDGGSGNFSSVTLRYQPSKPSIKSLEDKAQAGYWYDVLQQLVVNHSPDTNAFLKQIDIDIFVL